MFRITVCNHITPTILCAYIVFTSSIILGLVRTPAGIVGKQATVFIAELGKPFKTWCLTYGEPPPQVAWFRVKSYDTELAARGNLLQLNISYNMVGDYVCQASNSVDHVATWLVIIKAYQTENVVTEYNPHILPRLRIENLKNMEDTTLIGSLGPVRTPAGIVGKQETVLIAELGKPFKTWCLTYGEPLPEVAWFRVKSYGMKLVARGNLLHLHISYKTVGDYVCQASNSVDHVATWMVIIKAYQTEDVEIEYNPHILPPLRIGNPRVVESTTRRTKLLTHCMKHMDVGKCTKKQPAWFFSQTEDRCVPFYYSGCGGNGNRFDSEQNCAQACPSAYVPDMCTLPAAVGDCADYRERWYYDTTQKSCLQFYYGGCGGNSNNFASQLECEGRCSEPKITIIVRPTEAQAATEMCFMEREPGPCRNTETRWVYD